MSRLVLVLSIAASLLATGCGGVGDERDGSAWRGLPAGWSRLPPSSFPRSGTSSVWTGWELLTWGGTSEYGDAVHADGAGFDPALGEWDRLPPAPLTARASAAAVWTGEEMLVWGGWAGDGDDPALRDGAAYEPEKRTWRTLSAAPLGPRVPVGAAWTGREMLVWGDVSRFETAVDGAAYDPATDHWRALPPAPLALNEARALWTGREMVIVGALLDANNWSKAEHAQGIAFDPEANAWRKIAPFDLSPQASAAAWTGEEVVVWDYELEARAYDPETDSWRGLPDLPLRFSECYPASVAVGRAVFAWHCGGPAALFEVENGTWSLVSPPSVDLGAPLPAGDAIVFAVPKHRDATALWVYRP